MERGDPKIGYVALGVWSYAVPLKGCAAPVALVERRGEVGGVQVRNVIAPDRGLALIVFTGRPFDLGEAWQRKGGSYDLFSAALCPEAAK
jgi:D-alanyl-D-alanine carboxypeptidase